MEKKGKSASAKTSEEVQVKRRLGGDMEIYHDLFVLMPAYYLSNTFTPHQPKWDVKEHKHRFHTFDSNGRKQTHSTNAGGHCHLITVWVDEEGNLKAKCGPALQQVTRGNYARFGKRVHARTTLPKIEQPHTQDMWCRYEQLPSGLFVAVDEHTHEVEYERSEVIKARIVNEKAQHFIASFPGA